MQRRLAAFCVVVALFPAFALAETIAEWGFEQGLAGWQSADPQARVDLAAGEGLAAEGNFSLHVSYARPSTAAELQQRGPMLGGVLKLIDQPFHGVPTCLEFAIRTKMPTALVVAANEGDGSNYVRLITIFPDQWQRVSIYLNEFALSDDSSDENGRLDGDQIRGLGFVDAYGLFLMLSEAAKDAPFRLAGMRSGDNEIWLDAVRLTDRQPEREQVVEDASAGAPRFVALLGPALQIQRFEDRPDAKPTWQLRYELREREIGMIVWPLPQGLLAEAAGLRVVLGASSATDLLLQVEERDGSKYNYVLHMAPGQQVAQVIAWPDFRLDDQSTDENGRLDPGQIKSVVLADATSLFRGVGHQNLLRISTIEPAR